MLVGRGLSVAVVKHDAHGFEVDKPGKDSDRLFRAGATISLRGPHQQFERRGAGAALTLESTLARLGFGSRPAAGGRTQRHGTAKVVARQCGAVGRAR